MSLNPPTRFLSLDTINVVHIYSFAFLERQVGFQCLFHLWCGISLVAYSWDCMPPIRSLGQCHHHSTHSWWLLCIHVNCCVLHVASLRSQSSPISWSSLLVFNVQTMLLSTLGSSWSNAWHLAHGIPHISTKFASWLIFSSTMWPRDTYMWGQSGQERILGQV